MPMACSERISFQMPPREIRRRFASRSPEWNSPVASKASSRARRACVGDLRAFLRGGRHRLQSDANQRLRNSHSRCARFSVPARILSMFERCV